MCKYCTHTQSFLNSLGALCNHVQHNTWILGIQLCTNIRCCCNYYAAVVVLLLLCLLPCDCDIIHPALVSVRIAIAAEEDPSELHCNWKLIYSNEPAQQNPVPPLACRPRESLTPLSPPDGAFPSCQQRKRSKRSDHIAPIPAAL